MFMIAPPYAPTLDGNAAGAQDAQRAVGQCTGDTFQAGNSPVICGANDGQHSKFHLTVYKCRFEK